LEHYKFENQYSKLFHTIVAPSLAEGGDGSFSWTTILHHMYSPKERPNEILIDDFYGVICSYLEEPLPEWIILERRSRLQLKFGEDEDFLSRDYKTVEHLRQLGQWMDYNEFLLRFSAVSNVIAVISCLLYYIMSKFQMSISFYVFSAIGYLYYIAIRAIISKHFYYRLNKYLSTAISDIHFLSWLLAQLIKDVICYLISKAYVAILSLLLTGECY